MQLSFRQKAQFFHELAQLAKSGIPLTRGFEIMSRGSSAIARTAGKIGRELRVRGTVSQAFAASGFPLADGALIEAGESTGRLEQIYEELQRYYGEMANAKGAIIKRSIYPLLMLHLGAVLMSIAPAIMSGDLATFWKGVFSLLVIFYGLALGFIILIWLARRAFALSSAAGYIIAAIPVIGGFFTAWSTWKFSMVFSLYVRSGGGLLKGLGIAGLCSESAILRNASRKAVDRVQSGLGLAEALRTSRLPETLERAIEVGEESGRLDEEIQRAAEIFKERFFQRLDTFGIWIPKIAYLLILLLLGWRIVESYSQMMGSVGKILDGESF